MQDVDWTLQISSLIDLSFFRRDNPKVCMCCGNWKRDKSSVLRCCQERWPARQTRRALRVLLLSKSSSKSVTATPRITHHASRITLLTFRLFSIGPYSSIIWTLILLAFRVVRRFQNDRQTPTKLARTIHSSSSSAIPPCIRPRTRIASYSQSRRRWTVPSRASRI